MRSTTPYTGSVMVMRQTRAENYLHDHLLDRIRIISIIGKFSDIRSFPEPLPKNHKLHTFLFEDVTDPEFPDAFSQKQARKIWKVADKAIRRNEDLLIHCEAGESRSAAIGVAIGMRYNVPVRFFEYKDLLVEDWASVPEVLKPNKLCLDYMLHSWREGRTSI